MADYTHNFEIEFGDFKMDGDVEFNIDGHASFETDSALPNVTVDQLRKIQTIFKAVREAFVEFGGEMTKVKIEEK